MKNLRHVHGARQKASDPTRFPDLSLAVIKLMGAGEYIAELPGDTAPGHFGLSGSWIILLKKDDGVLEELSCGEGEKGCHAE